MCGVFIPFHQQESGEELVHPQTGRVWLGEGRLKKDNRVNLLAARIKEMRIPLVKDLGKKLASGTTSQRNESIFISSLS